MSARANRFINNPIFLFAIFILIFLFYILNINCDPSFIRTVRDFGDEGYWVHNARNAVVFGHARLDDFNQSLLFSPLYYLAVKSVFSFFGVGFTQARIVSVIPAFFTALLIFMIIKHITNTKMALLAAIIFVFIHENYMYVKWASPIQLEYMFITGSLYLWLIKKKSIANVALSGLCIFLAILSKNTALFLLPCLAVFVFLEGRYKRVTKGEALIYVFSIVLPIILFVLFFILPNLYSYKLLAVSFPHSYRWLISPLGWLRRAYNVLMNKYFALPGIFLLIFSIVNYYIARIFAVVNVKKWEPDTIETFCFSWLFGYLFFLGLIGDYGDRRLVQFVVPFTLLFVHSLSSKGMRLNHQILPRLLFLLNIAWIMFMFRTYKTFIFHLGNIGCNIYCSLVILAMFSVSTFVLEGLFFKQKYKLFYISTIAIMFIISFIMNVNWLIKPSYTIYNASLALKERASYGAVVLGECGHILSIENKMLPILWVPHTPSFNRMNQNIWEYKPQYYVQEIIMDSRPLVKGEGWGWPEIKDFKNKNLSYLNTINLYPYPMTDKFRIKLVMYKVL